MKTRFGMLLIALLLYVTAIGQAHITIDNPSTWSGEALRPYIGQTVIFDVPIIVCNNENGNYIVSPWRRFHPESHGFPDSEDYKSTVRVNSKCMFNIDNIPSPTSAMKEPMHRCGEKIIGLKARVNSTYSLTWISGTWSGNTRADLESKLPDLGDYRLLVCGFNVENYFMTWGSMGARSYSEHQAQRAKVSKALKRINADIFGLVEIEQGSDAVQEIVGDLNKNLPDRSYKYIGNSTGSSQSAVFVYDSKIVEPIGIPAGTDEEVADRKKMICFREKETGEKFIYSINHFKSMNTGDEERRFKEAQAVVKLYNVYRNNPHIREKDVLFMGDMNCYAFTKPIKVFTDHGMIDLHRAFHSDSSYSYMYEKMASYIDHAISNGTMYRQVTGMAAYHINSDEDDRYNYQRSSDETMFRCSDHDPVLVGLKLDSTLVYDPTPQINTCEILSGESKKMIIQNAYTDGQQSFYAIYTINGWLVEQKNITSPLYEVELPNPAGVYIVTVYYNGQIYRRKMIVR